MRLKEEYKKTGYFWLPDQEENKISGTLIITTGGDIELEVVGAFDGNINSLNGEDDLSRIIGHIEDDGLVTLEKCFYSKKPILFDGISKSNICVNKVLSGVAYEKNEDITFNTLSFSVDCLDEWVGISGIHVKYDLDNNTAKIDYKPPEYITFLLDNGMQLAICFAYTLPGSPNLTEAKITQKAYFKLTSEVLRPLDDYINIASKLTNLMCFAIDATVTLKDMTATSMEIQRDINEGKTHPIPIKIYYPSIPFSEREPHQNWFQMLFSFDVIKTNAEGFFNNWLNAYETLSPAINLYFSTTTGGQKFLEGKFLALAQGLETYHRRTSDEKLMDVNVFNSLVKRVKINCPDERKNWLEGRLQHGNEINFGNRLKKIIEPFKGHIGSSKERCRLLRKIVDTRNYLTHYSEELKDQSAEEIELYYLSQKMEAIFSFGRHNDEFNQQVEFSTVSCDS